MDEKHASSGNRLDKHKKVKRAAAVFVFMAAILAGSVSFAAEMPPRYQIVAAGNQAYLLDTTTGFSWILTYRTIATGREPVAIPYKFIKISPANRNDFIVEADRGASALPNGVQ